MRNGNASREGPAVDWFFFKTGAFHTYFPLNLVSQKNIKKEDIEKK